MKEQHACVTCNNFALVDRFGTTYHCCLEGRILGDVHKLNNCTGYEYRRESFVELCEHDKFVIEKTIDKFTEKLCADVKSFTAEVNGIKADLLTLDYFLEFVFEVAEKLKGGAK